MIFGGGSAVTDTTGGGTGGGSKAGRSKEGGSKGGRSIGASEFQVASLAGGTVCQVMRDSSCCASNASHSRIFRRVYGGISMNRIPASFFVFPRHTILPPVSTQSSDFGK